VIIATSRLDPVSLEYLRRIESTRGRGSDGIYSWAPPPANPRHGWRLRLFSGLLCLGLAGGLALSPLIDRHNLVWLAYLQAAIAAIGVLLLMLGWNRWARKHLLGSFLYVDAWHIWEVGPDRVEVIPLGDLMDVSSEYHTTKCTRSEVIFHFPQRLHAIAFFDKRTADRLERFARLLVSLPQSDNQELTERVRSSPGLLGAVAIRLTDDRPILELDSLGQGPEPPRPRERTDSEEEKPAGSWRRAAMPWVAGVLAWAIGWFGFMPLDRYLLDEREWSRAEVLADKQHDPSGLRAYLANPDNHRHRRAAQERMIVYYDEVLARLKKRADPREKQIIDEEMFAGLLELIEGLKKLDHPVVGVAFHATQDPEPVREATKEEEKANYEAQLKEHPELEKVARAAPDNTAILPYGQAFSRKQTSIREDVILARLLESFKQGLGADVLTLRRDPSGARDGEKPIIEVAYHLHPAGTFYPYLSGAEEKPPAVALIRAYAIEWTITIRPPGSTKTRECKLVSHPASELKYEKESGDPAWAPYAIVLYSAFDDLSSRLVSNFALKPPKAPENYRFKAITTGEK
jgi:molybdopterin-guanine dinucleotide biosynthesis protein